MRSCKVMVSRTKVCGVDVVCTCGGVSGLEDFKAAKSDEGGRHTQNDRAALLLGVASVKHVTHNLAIRGYHRACSCGGYALRSKTVASCLQC